jgi:hypothetical protein
VSSQTTLAWRPGRLLAVQHIEGSNNAWYALPAGNGQLTRVGATTPLEISYTPPVDCYWDVSLNVMITKLDAAYHNAYATIDLSPVDLHGDSGVWQIAIQHNSVDWAWPRLPRRTFWLSRGVSYVARANYSLSGGSWQMHQGAGYLMMDGVATAAYGILTPP